MNLIVPFLRQAALTPDHPALIVGTARLTYGQLRAEAGKVAYWLQQAGVGKSDRVLLHQVTGPQYLALALGCAWAGCGVVMMAQSEPDAMDEMARAAGVTRVIAPARATGIPAGLGEKVIELASLLRALPERALPAAPADGVADRIWRVFFSSGTTGAPKAIGWSHRDMAMLLIELQSLYPGSPEERLFIGLSVSHHMGTLHALKTLHSGGTIILGSNALGDWLGDMQRHGATLFISSSYLAGRLAEQADALAPGTQRLAPASLKAICCGGGPLSPATHKILKRRFAPQVFVHFGATEVGLVGRTPEPGLPPRLMRWAEAQAVDEEGTPLPAGKLGELRFRTLAMPHGYLGNAEASARHFRDGWFHSGDMGAVLASGVLSLAGRMDERLNIGGVKLSPSRVEAMLERHPAVVEAGATLGAVDGQAPALVALVVLRKGIEANGLAAALKEACREALGPGATPRTILAVDSLPRNSAGKLSRESLPNLAANAKALA